MKRGDTVYMATVQGIDTFYFVEHEGLRTYLTQERAIALKTERPSFHRSIFSVRSSAVFLEKKKAIEARIEMLRKSIRTMETTAANHQRTIRALQRELREWS
jgi:hypothetical protein